MTELKINCFISLAKLKEESLRKAMKLDLKPRKVWKNFRVKLVYTTTDSSLMYKPNKYM